MSLPPSPSLSSPGIYLPWLFSTVHRTLCLGLLPLVSFWNIPLIFCSDSSLILTILPKAAAPTAFLASAFSIVSQELSPHLLRLLQVEQEAWEAADPAVSVENSGWAERVCRPPHAQEQYHVCCQHCHMHFPGEKMRQWVWLPGRSWSWPSRFRTVSGLRGCC